MMRALVLIALACIAVGALVAWRHWPATEYRLYRMRAMQRELVVTPPVSTSVDYHCRSDDGSP